MSSSTFKLDLFERLLPLKLDEDQTREIYDVVFWAMSQVLQDVHKEMTQNDMGDPIGSELWNRSCALLVQNKSLYDSMEQIRQEADDEFIQEIASCAVVMGEPKLVKEILLDRDVGLLDQVKSEVLVNLAKCDDRPQTDVIESTFQSFQTRLKNS